MSSAVATVESAEPPAEAAASSRPSKRMIGALVAALVIGGVGLRLFLTRGDVSTDDAMVDADIVAVQTQVEGTVRQVLFEENRPVRAGQVLVILDQTEPNARVAEARANVAAAEAAAEVADAEVAVVETRASGDVSVASATLRAASAAASTRVDGVAETQAELARAQASAAQAQNDLRRMTALRSDGSVAEATYEQAETASRLADANVQAVSARLASLGSSIAEARGHVAEANARVRQAANVDVLVAQARAQAAEAHARVDVAKAALALAEIGLANTRVMAPADGYVSHRNVQVGQLVQAGHGVAQLVKTERWITANFKETQLEGMHPGQPVEIHVDAFPDAEIWARVGSVSGATGSRFTLLPPDNASGNFTKVVQRIPVRIELGRVPRGVELLPGMNVDVVVHTLGSRS